ncbi:MAG TPA: allophanate hydrolase subunit 1 [Gaiellaceae bacterium]|nr:allophanate hydrolase subunit 1 [Gaiellaceae bacterium]
MNARRAGDRGWLLEVDEPARVAAALRRAHPELEEVVPGHETVLVVGDFTPGDIPLDEIELPPPTEIVLAVDYDGPDLDEVAGLTGLTVDEVVAIHSGATYTAAFLGGVGPGFAYLVGIDERLVVPRRHEPRTRVPGGTVGIAGPYSGVYPRETPGGWRLLGRTDAVFFDVTRERPSLINAGDTVRFVPR